MPCTVPTCAGVRAWVAAADITDPGRMPTENEKARQAR